MKKSDIAKVRDLEESGPLNRHHIFPRKVLEASFANEQINHGLNCVLLGKSSNQSLSNKDPGENLQWIRDLPSTGSEQELVVASSPISFRTQFSCEKGRSRRGIAGSSRPEHASWRVA